MIAILLAAAAFAATAALGLAVARYACAGTEPLADGPPPGVVPQQLILLGAGLLGVALLANLQRLPLTGALLVVSPLRLVGGTGSPSRVYAFVARE